MGEFGFHMQDEAGMTPRSYGLDETQPGGNLPAIKPEDAQYFGKLLTEVKVFVCAVSSVVWWREARSRGSVRIVEWTRCGKTDSALFLSLQEDELDPEEAKQREILKLLLKIKNGTPPMRKSALRRITDKAREFGAGPLFNEILPLLMSPSLEDQERHLLVKIIDRILYKLDDLVRPYVHKILVVIEPLLIDEDYYARVEVCWRACRSHALFSSQKAAGRISLLGLSFCSEG
jgi:hypothetical protein